ITQGVGQEMPGYAENLSDEQRWALAAFVRSLALSAPADPATATRATEATASGGPTPTMAEGGATAGPTEVGPATAEPAGRISGRVINGTAGAKGPPPLGGAPHGV